MKKLGKYEVLDLIGSGGFGTVYKATDTIGRTVVLKVLKPGWSDDPSAIERFRREALAAGSLFHPRIATILDFDQAGGRMFLVVRYVDGPALDRLIKGKGRIGWNEAVKILNQVAEGLDYAHQQGYIHRDVKPANILVSEKEGAVLTDFGLVKAAQTSGLSTSGVLLGTPNYIAPEIWNGKEATPATDVYSLACVFFEMITDRLLFDGVSTPQIMTQHVLQGPKFPETWPQDVPAGLQAVLEKALSKEPAGRYQSAQELAQAVAGLQLTEKKSEAQPAVPQNAPAPATLFTAPAPVQAEEQKTVAPHTAPQAAAPTQAPAQVQAQAPVVRPQPAAQGAGVHTSGLAIASLVLGLFSPLGGVPAIITGVMAVKKVAASNGTLSGKGMATAGIILGCLGMVVFGCYLMLMFAGIVPSLIAAPAVY